MLFDWLIACLVGGLVGWLVGGLVGWLVGGLVGWLVVGWLVGGLVGWWVGWLVSSWWVGWLVGGLMTCMLFQQTSVASRFNQLSIHCQPTSLSNKPTNQSSISACINGSSMKCGVNQVIIINQVWCQPGDSYQPGVQHQVIIINKVVNIR